MGVKISYGLDRDMHAANIANAEQMKVDYAKLHDEIFIKNGLEKYKLVNADGTIINSAKNPEAALKLITNANGTVRHEDFLIIQDRIVEVRRRALNGIADLMAAGLTFSAPIESQLVGFENINEFQEAKQEMNPNSYQNNDTVFTEVFTPNPITHQSFSVPFRNSGFDYKRSLGLTESIRQVSERLEDTLFNGNTAIVARYDGANQPIYGYTTHPNRGTGTISDWTNSANLANIVNETVEQVGAMRENQGDVANNSLIMYVSNSIWSVLQKDYKADSEKTVLNRLLDIAEIRDVKPAEKLAGVSAVLVEMEARSIELAIASDIVAVPHLKTNPMAPAEFTTYAAMVHQIKKDSNDKTGVRHLTTA